MTTAPQIVDAAMPSLEDRFRRPDGSIDMDAAQAHLQTLQARGDSLTTDEIREAISLVRILRRTNTGPAGTKKGGKTKAVLTEPDDLLNL